MTDRVTASDGDNHGDNGRDCHGRFAHGNKLAGSRKGQPNRITTDLKAAFMAAFDAAGGLDYLIQFARKHPERFLPLLARLLPTAATVDATVSTPLGDRRALVIHLLAAHPELLAKHPEISERYRTELREQYGIDPPASVENGSGPT